MSKGKKESRAQPTAVEWGLHIMDVVRSSAAELDERGVTGPKRQLRRTFKDRAARAAFLKRTDSAIVRAMLGGAPPRGFEYIINEVGDTMVLLVCEDVPMPFHGKGKGNKATSGTKRRN